MSGRWRVALCLAVSTSMAEAAWAQEASSGEPAAPAPAAPAPAAPAPAAPAPAAPTPSAAPAAPATETSPPPVEPVPEPPPKPPDAAAWLEAADERLQAGALDEGCELLQRALRSEPRLSTQQRLASCREAQGRGASAWRLYVQIARELEDLGERAAARAARKKLGELEKRMSYLVVLWVGGAEPAPIALDEQPLAADQLGLRTPIDPGVHELTWRRDEGEPVRRTLEVSSSGATVYTVKLGGVDAGEPFTTAAPLEEQEQEQEQAPTPGAAESPPAPRSAPDVLAPRAVPGRQPGPFWTGTRVLGLSLAGAGTASLGGALAFAVAGGKSRKAADQAHAAAGDDTTPQAIELRAEAAERDRAARSQRTAAVVFGSAGGALLLTGVMLWFTGHRRVEEPAAPSQALRWTPYFAGASAGVHGSF